MEGLPELMRYRRPEQATQRAVFQHIAARGVTNLFAFHPWAGGWRSPVEARVMSGAGVRSGLLDVFLVHGGRVFGLELKSEGGRLSPAQQAAHEELRRAGAEVAVAVGIDEALAQLETWALLRGHVT
jgi:hypothetical protein